jgi:23S rRNA pseudouridine2605 synthase
MKKQNNRSGKGKPDFRKNKNSSASSGDKRPFEKYIKEKSSERGFPPKRKRDGEEEKGPRKRSGFRQRDDHSDPSYRAQRSETSKRTNRSFSSKPERNSSENSDRRSKPGTSERSERTGTKRPNFSGKGSRERSEGSSFGDRKREGHFRSSDRNKKTESDRKFSGDDKGEFKKRGERRQKPFFREDKEGEKRFAKEDFIKTRSFDKHEFKSKNSSKAKDPFSGDGLIRLNKYLSNAGVASRRDADDLIASGAVKVNGVVVDQLGYKIKSTDKVTYGDQSVKGERKVYLLLNKPKDYITTMDDPQERKTVMLLIAGACRERVYPVGRLDRNTTGLLLFTNDGELAAKLTHPKHNIKKVYHVSLNKGLRPDDFKAITEGVELEDGLVKADDLAFVGEGKKEIGIEIHSGRNRVVRRLFEHLGYDVIKLDRVVFAGLTKKDLPRGKHRFLSAKEIAYLQMIG